MSQDTLYTAWPYSVFDVAVPCSCARLRWQKCLREPVPLGEGKHAGVNLACRWGEAWCYIVVSSMWHAQWPNSVCDVTVPRGFARLRWNVRFRECVLLRARNTSHRILFPVACLISIRFFQLHLTFGFVRRKRSLVPESASQQWPWQSPKLSSTNFNLKPLRPPSVRWAELLRGLLRHLWRRCQGLVPQQGLHQFLGRSTRTSARPGHPIAAPCGGTAQQVRLVLWR